MAVASTRRVVVIVAVPLLVLAVALGLAAFQPWKLWTHSYVDEALPGLSTPPVTGSVARPAPAAGGPTATRSNASRATPIPAPGGPVIVRSGAFVSGEHRTTGRALLVRRADGSYLVRLEDLDTSDGPDVHIVLSTAPPGSGDVGDHLRLGRLKATSGNQNYVVPAGTDPQRYRSVAVWCRRFDAVFGAAPLDRG